MKEIKFRCWNAFSCVMQSWEDMVSMNKIHLLANQKKEYPVMQFTGLKDKNGVEIYEGDIVGFGDDTPENKTGMYGELGVVLFDDNTAQYRARLIESGRSVVLACHTLFSDGSVCRVVYGNIYENPELISE